MKHFFTTLFALALFIYAQSQSSSTLPQKQTFEYGSNVIKLNTLSFIVGTIEATYERVLTPNISALGTLAYTFAYLDQDVSGAVLGGEFRYYLSNKKFNAPRGWHLGPVLNYTRARNSETKETVNGLGTGLGLGYQWIWQTGMTLDIGASPQYVSTFSNSSGDNSFVIPVQVAIGYNF